MSTTKTTNPTTSTTKANPRLVKINPSMSTWTYNQSQRKVEAFDLDSIKQALQNGDTVYRIHKAPYKGGNRQSFANPYVLQDDNLFVNLMPFPTQTWEIDMASIVTQAREIYREQQALTTLEKDYYASVATQEAASPEATA